VVVGRREFFVRELGPVEAPPLVLIHGWVYDSLVTWHRVMFRFAERRRVIAVDLRNHGRSERIPGAFGIADLADQVAGMMDALGIPAADVVGYSMGGMTAQELARRHPGKVRRLVLAATAARPLRYPRWISGPVFVIGRALARLDPLLFPRIGYAYLRRTGTIPPEHAAWLWQELVDRDVDLYYEAGFAIRRFDASGWVGRLDKDVLCVVPGADQLIPPRRQRETAALIPGSRVVELPGARHEAVLTHADEIAAAVEEFLD
jgi:pimeloyl-ACP methyl ester carboxylesterase